MLLKFNNKLLLYLISLILIIIGVNIYPFQKLDKVSGMSFNTTGSFIGGDAYPLTKPQQAEKGLDIKTLGSWVGPELHIGTAQSKPFIVSSKGDSSFNLLISGHPNKEGNSISIEDETSNKQMQLYVVDEPGTEWRKYSFKVPKTLLDIPISIKAVSNSTGMGNWIGLSEPYFGSSKMDKFEQIYKSFKLTVILLFQFFAILLVGFSILIFGAEFFQKKTENLIFSIVIFSLLAYLNFWIYLIRPEFGSKVSLIILILSAVNVAHQAYVGFSKIQNIIKVYTGIISIWITYSILCLCLAGLHEGYLDLLSNANQRFFHWTADNELPLVYALKILGLPQSFIWQNWDVYTRPPLQTAFFLMLSPISIERDSYQTLGIILQTSYILGIWVALKSFRINQFAINQAIFFCIFSIFSLMNSVFIWPKLLSAGYAFLAIGVIASNKGKLSPQKFALLGACLGLLMLSHGGGFFAAAGILITWFSIFISSSYNKLNFGKSFKACSMFIFALLFFLAPWIVYSSINGQDPSQQIKWHLGGWLPSPDSYNIGSLEAIISGYKKLSFYEVIQNKLHNLMVNTPHIREFFSAIHGGSIYIRKFLILEHSRNIFYNIYIPLFSILAYVIHNRFKKNELELFRALNESAPFLKVGVITTIFWLMAMFGEKMAYENGLGGHALAIIPQGSYFVPLCLMISLSIITSGLFGPYSIGITTIQLFTFMWIGFQDAIRPVPSQDFIQQSGTINIGFLLLGLLSLYQLVFVWLKVSHKKIY
jgi:hypothetical protein